MNHLKFVFVSFILLLVIGCSQNERDTPAPNNNAPQPEKENLSSKLNDTELPDKNLLSEKQQVQKDVRKFISALYDGDVEIVIEYTYPKIIESMGGVSQAKEFLMKTVVSQLQSKGMKLKSLDFPEEPTFINTKVNSYAIIVTKITISTEKNQRAESLNYQFGVKPIGSSKWTYIEGSRINKNNIQLLFPDFPSDYQFPQTYRKVL